MEEFTIAAVGNALLALSQRQIDHQRPPNNIVTRHKSPVAAVQAVIAIVPHDKVPIRRNHQFSASKMTPELRPPASVYFTGKVRVGREVVAVEIAIFGNMPSIILLERHVVYVNDLVAKADFIAGQTNHTLHKMLGWING